MFLRLVTHTVRGEESESMAATYTASVLSTLRTTKGCVFASLLQNTDNAQECISLTIWNSQKESFDYEESGSYQLLVDSLRPYFVASNEYSLQLSADLSLEYTPIQVEPTVERFNNSVAGSENISRLKTNPFAVQMLTLTVQEDQIDTFEHIFRSEIHPRFKTHKGFINLILLRQQREYHIISFWDETVDIQSASGIHSINELLTSIYKILPSFIRWKVSHSSAVHTSASSEDIKATVHRCLVAEWFTN
jgi:heme-degrading monooxygenase HmoA